GAHANEYRITTISLAQQPEEPPSTFPPGPDDAGELLRVRLVNPRDGLRITSLALTEGMEQIVVAIQGSTEGMTDPAKCSLRLLDFKTGAEIRRFEGANSELREVTLSADGKHVLAKDEKLNVWELATGKMLRTAKLGAQGRLGFSL